MNFTQNAQELSYAALIAGLLCASTTVANAAAQSAPPAERQAPAMFLTAASPIESLCQEGEEAAFSGDIQDDFGLTISVCIAPVEEGGNAGSDPTISIRSRGEGGGNVLSCQASECDGVIEFQHYRRARFTELTLKWYQNGSEQVLIETFDAQYPDGEPHHSISHTWQTKEATELGLDATPYPVTAKTAPLSMLALDSHLAGAAQEN
ncbi:MAG: hypothetical protein AAGL10_15040 [Pseudomonadota bacterium]